ncbi:MAG: C39 family peptidase [Burkholderiaceae bacterium]
MRLSTPGAALLSWLLSAPLFAYAGTVFLPSQIGGAYAVPASSLKEARFRATIRQKYDFSCGSAALATLLTHHYRHTVNEEQVFSEMFASGDQPKIQREGFSLLDMKRYLLAKGFEADGFEAPLSKLADAKIPALVLVNERGYNHFIVVKGIRDGRVLVGDPAGGTRAMSIPVFESIWQNQILFVVTSHPGQARFNLESDWRLAPRAPINQAASQEGVQRFAPPKFGPGDF